MRSNLIDLYESVSNACGTEKAHWHLTSMTQWHTFAAFSHYCPVICHYKSLA